MPSKHQFGRLRRLRLIGTIGAIAVPAGGVALISSSLDAVHLRAGGVTGVIVGFVVCVVGLRAVTWAIRAHRRVAVDELRDLRAQGLDDGLPLGVFRRDQRIGLDASDTWLVLGVLAAGVGLLFAVAGAADPAVGWRFGLMFSMVGFVPAVLCARLGTGTKYWLTPDGVARRSGRQVAVRYADVERIVPLHNGDPTPMLEAANALELQVAEPSRRPFGGSGFAIKLILVEVGGADLMPILDHNVRSARISR